MRERYRPPGIDPPPKAEVLGSPALHVQRRMISAIGRAEMDREDAKAARKKPVRKRVSGKQATGK